MIGSGSLIRCEASGGFIFADEVDVGTSLFDPVSQRDCVVRGIETVSLAGRQKDLWLIPAGGLQNGVPGADCVLDGDQPLLVLNTCGKLPFVQLTSARVIGIPCAFNVTGFKFHFDHDVYVDCCGLLLLLRGTTRFGFGVRGAIA